MINLHPRRLVAFALAGALASPAFAQIAFDPATDYAAATRPEAAALADLDGNGSLDMALAVDAPDRILVFFNNGDGTFGAPTALFTGAGTGAHTVVAADLDGDSDNDLAVTLANSNSVQIWTNAGGVFTQAGSFGTALEPRRMAAGDVSGDGSVDLVTANRDGNSVSVLINTGTGSFGAATTYTAGTDTRDVTLGHFNGDSALDLAASSHDTRQVIVRFNDGLGGFAASQTLSVGGNVRPEGLTTADVDGDLDDDLVAATSDNALGFAAVFTNNAGTLSGPTNWFVGNVEPGDIAAGDFNADGLLDLATSNEDYNNASVIENLGGGSFGAATILPAGTNADGIAAGDLDGNGSDDLVVSNRDSNTVSVFLSQAGETLTLAMPVPGTAGVANTVDISGATPFGTVLLAVGRQVGSTPVTGCPGLFWDIRNAFEKGSVSADMNGNASITKVVPNRFAGILLRLQVADMTTCTTSNRVDEVF